MTKNKAIQEVALMKNIRNNLLVRLANETDRLQKQEIREAFNRMCDRLQEFRHHHKEHLQ